MNKYLLLRDNKQTGPYTVSEIIAKGIKPYDLVWLEGKSAAWRYPSEVEELKAYAPTVEEQPFDRFYKKPQAVKAGEVIETKVTSEIQETTVASHEKTHADYQPKTVQALSSEKTGSKKVYINFPAAVTATVPNIEEPATQRKMEPIYTVQSGNSERETVPPIISTPAKIVYPERSNSERSETPVAKRTNRLFQLTIAACVLMGLVTGILFVDYNRQRETLNELNTLVQEIQNREKQQQHVPATLVQNDAPVDPLPSTVNTEPADPLNTENTAIVEPESRANATAVKKARPTPAVNPVENTEAAIVFRENKPGERPVERRTEQQAEPQPQIESVKQNLFKMVDVKPNQYKTGLLGGISNLKFELTNKSDVELQRVAVEVKYLGPEKKVVKTHTIYFENVSPGAQSTVEVPKSNRGVTIEYTITDIKI